MNSFTQFFTDINENFLTFWQSIDLADHPYFILDIILVALFVYSVILIIKGTRAVPIFLGIVILAVVFVLSDIIQLSALKWLLGHLMTIMIIAIPIVFRDEIRKALEKIGQMKLFSGNQRQKGVSTKVSLLIDTLEYLAGKKYGGSVVIERDSSLQEFIETGISVNAELSKELLISIFYPGTPLHDGAVILRGNNIAAASCTLPISTQSTDTKFGTRHKSALGLTEQTDAIVLVVSEERGEVSLANNGALTANISLSRLERILLKILKSKK